jgi:hypothetical protein
MEMRAFGRTGLHLSVLGFGSGAVGGLMVRGDSADQESTIAGAIAAVQKGPLPSAALYRLSGLQRAFAGAR